VEKNQVRALDLPRRRCGLWKGADEQIQKNCNDAYDIFEVVQPEPRTIK
jgi:hypothetical protein